MIAFLLLIALLVVLYFAYWRKKDEYIDNIKQKVVTEVKSKITEEKPQEDIESLIYKKYKI